MRTRVVFLLESEDPRQVEAWMVSAREIAARFPITVCSTHTEHPPAMPDEVGTPEARGTS